MTSSEFNAEFNAECKKLCPHCAAGEPVRVRVDTGEHVHDFSFGAPDPMTGRARGRGHTICQAHEFRKQNG